MDPTAGEYFYSRVMKQWEETDDDSGDGLSIEMCGLITAQDLDWIASQLEVVPPDIRYRMDPKYCTDIPYRPQDEKDDIVTTQRQSSGIPTATTATTQSKSSPGDDDLDLLLNLSVCGSSQVKSTSPAESINAPSIPTRIEAETEHHEDWLDDVLNMKQCIKNAPCFRQNYCVSIPGRFQCCNFCVPPTTNHYRCSNFTTNLYFSVDVVDFLTSGDEITRQDIH
ncbi:hypothetical protein PsorP6_007459 [Peronosclerospora sorghi]|uniref:Uncharacterized protein n=1 Tax=Peronosclerospora sorghi TaxID=230839 RepID=A0ACC0W7L5_9STRA|nr:hypothetical protein PsorP6_007459 [Peronosclerospora sorghi]